MQNLLLWLRAEWDRIIGSVLLVAGGISLVATYQAVANDRFVAEQMADLASGGLGGLFLVAVGVMLRLQADLHDEWRKLDRIEAALRGEPLPDPTEVLAEARSGAPVARPAPPVLQPALTSAAEAEAAAAAPARRWIGAGPVLAVVGLTHLVGRSRLATRKVRLLGGFLRPGPGPVAAAAVATSGEVLVAPGLTRFHRDGCPTLVRTATTRLARADVNGGLTACQICGAS